MGTAPHVSADDSSSDGRRFLRTYLADHRGGAEAGRALVQRFRTANEGTPLAATLEQIGRQIDEDLGTLERVMQRLEVKRNPVKAALGRIVELVMRSKLNGRLLRYSPLSRVLELEALSAGILTKQSMWQSLELIAPERPELAEFDFAELVRRARRQRETLEEHRERIVAAAFRHDAASATS